MKITVYRADNYSQNTGDFQGFFLDLELAKRACEYKEPVEMADGNFSQVTEFEVKWLEEMPEVDKYGRLDNDVIFQLWEDGNKSEIIKDYYFV